MNGITLAGTTLVGTRHVRGCDKKRKARFQLNLLLSPLIRRRTTSLLRLRQQVFRFRKHMKAGVFFPSEMFVWCCFRWKPKTAFPHGPHVLFFSPPRKASISQVCRFAALIQSIYTEAASLRRSSCGNKCTVEALIFRRLEELCMKSTLLKRPVAHYFLILGKLCVIVYPGVCARSCMWNQLPLANK